MEELARKRPGRPRKPVDVPATAAEAQSPANHDDGVGETGSAGHSALADDAGQAENGLGWDAFCLKVDAVVRSHGHDFVKAAVFPEPQADVIESEYAVPVQAGPVGLVNIHNQTLPL
jgi:hypothetical protein